ncbi:MAG: tRNA lysidine(34) synthetase TilS [Nitritalea sp.]
MLDKFQAHLRTFPGFDPKKPTLLAISGGLDSTALLHLMRLSGFPLLLAHVNYGLRGAQSDGDEAFVRELASRYRLPLLVKRCQPGELKKVGGGTQEAARIVRYSWFESILKQHPEAQALLLAHHQEDQAETLLLQLLRGTGLKGMGGMRATQGPYWRPLLPFSKKELHAFLHAQQLLWREDASNADSHYQRNYLRNVVFPQLEARFPQVYPNISRSTENAQSTWQLQQHLTRYFVQKEWTIDPFGIGSFGLEALRALGPGLPAFLHQLLLPLGFHSAALLQLSESIREEKPKECVTHAQYQLLIDRGRLYLHAQRPLESLTFSLPEEGSGTVLLPGGKGFLDWAYTHVPEKFPKDPFQVWLDPDTMTAPLLLRPWRQGDRMQPFGMRGQKKLSDYFIDKKLSLLHKNHILVLISQEIPLWVAGVGRSAATRLPAAARRCLHMTIRYTHDQSFFEEF